MPPRDRPDAPAAAIPGPLAERVEAWLGDDPDPADRAELALLRDAAGSDAERLAELADRFRGPLTFGTAGLRGPLRAGPAGMNTAVVRRAAAGLAAFLTAQGTAVSARTAHGTAGSASPSPTVVIGYDARHRSEAFAVDSARVFAGAGLRALLLPGPVPTPVLAFAVRRLDAAAGVMVTASHNPASDNGYKVYLGGAPDDPGRGAQLVAPADARIERAIAAVGSTRSIPLAEAWQRLDGEIVDAYVRAAAEIVTHDLGDSRDPGPDRGPGLDIDLDIRPGPPVVAYSPLHGVGARVLAAVFASAGMAAPAVVPEQAEPDPDFPTVPWPNPEEPGALDRVLDLGARIGADLVLANDPDADRCAVAVGRRVLTGDEIGLLLADHLLRSRPGPVATTVVSSSALRALAADAGVPFIETLTGFKWIMRADPRLAFGYEEALGYAVAPDLVRDKDGITAALAVALIAARAKRRGRTLLDLLDELHARLGVHLTAQRSVRFDELGDITEVMRRLRAHAPAELAGRPVTAIRDLNAGTGAPALQGRQGRQALPASPVRPVPSALPAADVLILRLDADRMIVRPSGTEPKLKIYLETVEPVADRAVAAVPAARDRASARLAHLHSATDDLLAR